MDIDEFIKKLQKADLKWVELPSHAGPKEGRIPPLKKGEKIDWSWVYNALTDEE